ncbi:acyl-CoA carboxylase subunit epsilon [Streptomyces sp. 6N223]|uniref:acyl-CoA carboxylase subunit epsilon n=1 Tax=Streptomyces sp. 6N223 TaxID=3457412 RepID=UPI003FD3A448
MRLPVLSLLETTTVINAPSGPIRVIKGRATAEELAALTAFLPVHASPSPAAPADWDRRPHHAPRFVPPRAFQGAHSWPR